LLAWCASSSAGELGSNFGEKVLGNTDTEHIIMVPSLAVLSLAEKTIKPLPEGAVPLTEAEAKALLRKVIRLHPSCGVFWL
jgi:4a-hydroxytetrahydrobiopterin dehydratase